jgi:chromosome segregation ATPase
MKPMNNIQSGHRNHNHSSETSSTLYVDRLLDAEVQDLREFTKIIEKQNREIVELKNTNIEMEHRLEHQMLERNDLESKIEDQEQLWDAKCQQLTRERDEFKKSLQNEEATNQKLWEIIFSKEKEITRAYQRKYDGSIQGRNRNYRNPAERSISHQSSIIGQRQSGLGASRNPHDLLHQSGAALSVQERNAIQMLEGFFGL